MQRIEWNTFKKPAPDDSVSHMVKSILLNANKYALGAWYDLDRKYKADSSGYLDLKSVSTDNEYRYRLPAGMAFGLAISIKTGIYDPSVTGVGTQEAKVKTVQLLSSVAYDHISNSTRKTWGGDWQAAHWAYYSGYAAWLLWEDLDLLSKQNIQRMIISEADHLLTRPVLYYKDIQGKSIFPGDSKIEENNWNAELLYLAAVMMPDHKSQSKWMQKAISYMISAVAMPSDLANEKVLHGKEVKLWLNGYNVEDPGIVVNHHIIHPLYNALSSVVNAPIVFSLVNKPTPEAARFNFDKIYNSLINTRFDVPKYEQPGGTMYIPGSQEVYYPQGSDWGKQIFDSYANMDIAAWKYGLDGGQVYNGRYWATLHLLPIMVQQRRFDDGHTYSGKEENSYYGREAAISTRMASAWMTIWMQSQRPAKYQNFLLK
ncbi:hypothetical protein LXM25_16675 [Dyadobacter sp. LJ53]|uniref:hypothetical protein n=1 Tax=Dyadobacter chenwenxiniae TaxID=2906456 RepID=UPI001F1E4F12|nr:hypothetical protein [Dyadobacter chenwenxiniae]MCF0051705.1 hypothetical protein [Dyadobacter chenwenxiniae]